MSFDNKVFLDDKIIVKCRKNTIIYSKNDLF